MVVIVGRSRALPEGLGVGEVFVLSREYIQKTVLGHHHQHCHNHIISSSQPSKTTLPKRAAHPVSGEQGYLKAFMWVFNLLGGLPCLFFWPSPAQLLVKDVTCSAPQLSTSSESPHILNHESGYIKSFTSRWA